MQIIRSCLLKVFVILIILPINTFAKNYECNLTVQTMDFGVIDVFDYNPEYTSSTVTVICQGNGIFSYVLSALGGTLSGRTLTKPGGSMNYNIYTNPSYTQAFIVGGSTLSYTSPNNYNAPETETQTYHLYGRIPVQPVSPPGTYTDNITVQIQYNRHNGSGSGEEADDDDVGF